MSEVTEGKLYSPNGDFVFYKSRASKDKTKPGIVYCSGYQSKLNEVKAEYLDQYCKKNGLGYVRFDYFGHELSSGTILDGTLTIWKQNLLDVLDKLTQGPQILIGYSAGGYVSLLGAIERPNRVHSLVVIANGTEVLHKWSLTLTEKDLENIRKIGYVKDGTGATVGYKSIMDCKNHLLLHKTIPIYCPVRLIHGMQDRVAPYMTSVEIAKKLASKDVLVHFVKNGDHKISTESDLKLLEDVLNKLLSIKEPTVVSAKL